MKELAGVLDDCLADSDVKIIVFSEWEGMLKKVRAWADRNGIGYAWHTGSVPQQKRRGEIRAFQDDPNCRLFLSTDSGGVGLNLQNASVVVNCDLPWNPAKLEQRIARAWRKHQKRPVTVVNLIAEDTIEHAMLGTLANKMNLSEGVLDGSDESLKSAKLKSGTEATLARLNQMLGTVSSGKPAPKTPPTDPTLAFAERAATTLGDAFVHCQEALLPGHATPVILTVVRNDDRAATFGPVPSNRLARQPPALGSWTSPPGPPSSTSSKRPAHPQHPRHPPPNRRCPARPKPALTPSNSSASPTSAPSLTRNKKSPDS